MVNRSYRTEYKLVRFQPPGYHNKRKDMKFTIMHDADTIGLALFYSAPAPSEYAPSFLRVHSIALILFTIVLEVTW